MIANGTVEHLRAEAAATYRLVCKRHENMPTVLPSLLERVANIHLEQFWEEEQTAYIKVSAQNSDPREDLMRLFYEAGFTVYELSREQFSLEDVFVKRIQDCLEPVHSRETIEVK